MSEREHPIYLDHNATTPLLPEVVDAMLPFLREHFGNPSSGHAYGRRAREAVALAREQVAALLEELEATGGAPAGAAKGAHAAVARTEAALAEAEAVLSEDVAACPVLHERVTNAPPDAR